MKETCEQRINSELERTISTIQHLWNVHTGAAPEDEEATVDSIYEYGLSFDYVPAEDTHDEKAYWRYQLSWGGPSDEFRFFADYDGRRVHLHTVEYWFMDWFDGAHLTLEGDDKRLLRQIWDWFDDCGTVEHVMQQAVEDL
jgi:hypothetical protein